MSSAEPSAASRERDLLDSWKSIAAYLGRSVRAVQKWEKSEGLPVHRQHHEKQGSVYAYRSELDAWMVSRRSPSSIANAGAVTSTGALRWIITGAAATVLAAVIWWVGRDSGTSEVHALSLQTREYVLVSALENGTGEAVFDGALEYLLERELSESPLIDVVSQERLADVLRLMRRDAGTRVDRALAREVAARDSAIRAVVAPRLEKLGNRYILGVDLLDARNGRRVAAFTATASEAAEIADAARTLSDEVRSAAGEQLSRPAAASGSLQNVTSPSLRAVQLFTQADRLIAFDNDAAAERLLRQSIAEDPGFASAHMHLAFAIANQRRPSAEYLPHARRAAELAAGISERERLFINGSLAHMEGRTDEALGHYRALLDIDPDHLWANGNVSTILRGQGRWEEAVPYRLRVAELRPNEFISNFMAAESLAHWAGRPAEAKEFFRRAASLVTPDDEITFPRQVVWARLHPAQEALLGGDRQAAIRELEAWTKRPRIRPSPSSDRLLANIGQLEVVLGRHTEAESITSLIRDPLERLRYEARLSLMTGRRAKARQAFERLLTEVPQPFAIDLLQGAQAGAAAAVTSALERSRSASFVRQIVAAELALARGERSKGIALYRDALPSSGGIGGRLLPLHLIAAGSLARALEAEGKRDEALAVLESARRHRDRLLSDSVPLWFALEQQMLRLDARPASGREK